MFTAEVFAQREDIFRRVLVHRCVGGRTDYDQCIRGITDYDHHGAQQCRIHGTGGDAPFLFDLFLYLRSKVDAKNCDHYDTDKDAAYAVSVEWNTQQGDGQNE